MKFAICKPFRRISCIPRKEINFSSELNKMIVQFIWKSGHEIDIWTNKSKRDDPKEFYGIDLEIFDVMENADKINDMGYDAIIIMSSTPNFYGGVINDAFVKLYEIINTFNGEVIIYLDDAQLMMHKSIYGINNKKSKEREYHEFETIINRPVNIITTFTDFEIHRKQGFEFKNEVYFPMEKMYLTYDTKMNKTWDKTIDTSYGGALKPNRMKYFKMYYLNNPEGFKSEIFFNFKQKQIDKFLTSGDQNDLEILNVHGNNFQFLKTHLNSAYSSIIFGDFAGEAKITPLRIYQTLMAGVVQLVDINFDSTKKIFYTSELKNLVYISSKEEMIEKIDYLKTLSKNEYFNIVQQQLDCIYTPDQEIYNDLNQKLYNSIGQDFKTINIRTINQENTDLSTFFN